MTPTTLAAFPLQIAKLIYCPRKLPALESPVTSINHFVSSLSGLSSFVNIHPKQQINKNNKKS